MYEKKIVYEKKQCMKKKMEPFIQNIKIYIFNYLL